MKDLLKFIGYGIMVLGVINLIFMTNIWGVCSYNYVRCTSLDEYTNEGFIVAMGVGGFLHLLFQESYS